MKIDRNKIYRKCGGRCGYCGDEIEIKAMTIDHIIPKELFEITVANKIHVPDFLAHLTESDVNHYDNLLPSCRYCNNYKGAYHLHEFRYELTQQLKRAEEKSVNFRLAKRYGMIQEIQVPEIIFYFEKLQKENSKEYLIAMEKYHIVQKALIERNLQDLREDRKELKTRNQEIQDKMDEIHLLEYKNNQALYTIKKQLEKFGEIES